MQNEILKIRSGISELSKTLTINPCKIAYLGNSITAQKDGYRRVLHEKINEHFGIKHEQINAGIGGVGSMACAFLMDDFVLRHKPDLCFVECLSADIGGATPLNLIGPAIEGIIKKLSDRNIKVCLLYLFRDLKESMQYSEIHAVYEKIADQYGIPSINIHTNILNLISEGKFEKNDILYDGVHTSNLGSSITADLIYQQVKNLLISTSQFIIQRGLPLYKNNFRFTEIIKVNNEMLIPNEKFRVGKFRNLIPYLDISQGNEIRFLDDEGDIAGAIVIADNDSGVVNINTEDKNISIQIYDQWCDKERIQVIIFDEIIPPNIQINILLSDEYVGERGASGMPNDHHKKGTSLKIIGFLVSRDSERNEVERLW